MASSERRCRAMSLPPFSAIGMALQLGGRKRACLQWIEKTEIFLTGDGSLLRLHYANYATNILIQELGTQSKKILFD
jgi:hypothetical protein